MKWLKIIYYFEIVINNYKKLELLSSGLGMRLVGWDVGCYRANEAVLRNPLVKITHYTVRRQLSAANAKSNTF